MSDQNDEKKPARPAKQASESKKGPDMQPEMPQGGIVPAGGTSLAAPAGALGGALALGADVSGELNELAPVFGNVLASIGLGVANSQAALDKSLVDTAKKLSDTTITVVTDVIQQLNDDGLPTIENTHPVTNNVSLINFVSPTVHEWKSVALSMDLTVGAIDRETGITFNKSQHKASVGGGGIWGFLGWFDAQASTTNTNINIRTDYEANWATGQVRMDALLGPRTSQNFPVPGQVQIGPQMYFSLGTVTEASSGGNVTRSIDVIIKVLKASGAVNPDKNIQISSPFPPSFASGGGFNGSTTNAQGEIKVTFSRTVPVGFRRVPGTVTASLGDISKTTQISL